MKPKTHSDYVSYNIETYFCREPEGPLKCLTCAGDLSKSAIEPSRVMKNKRKLADGLESMSSSGSWLFTCSVCHWWCIREGYEFVDSPIDPHRYGYDYLIVSSAANSDLKTSTSTLVQDIHPWLKALDDPAVYRAVQKLPKELAVLFKGGVTWEQEKRRSSKR